MTILSVAAAPPNSLILIMDRSVGLIPESMGGGVVSATRTCIAVGTRSEDDGPTSISLTTAPASSSINPVIYAGTIEVPSGRLSVCTVLGEPLLELVVSVFTLNVRVYADDFVEPNEIEIFVSE